MEDGQPVKLFHMWQVGSIPSRCTIGGSSAVERLVVTQDVTGSNPVLQASDYSRYSNITGFQPVEEGASPSSRTTTPPTWASQ